MNSHCLICNEPWDVYGIKHGDMKAWQADLFQLGHGCPCCKGKGNDKWIKPDPVVAFTCACCEKDITIDPDTVIYNGDQVTFEKPESFETHDGTICIDCKPQYTKCECGKLIHQDETFFFQDLNKAVCEDCAQFYQSCEKCGCTTGPGEVNHYNGKYYCDPCLKQISIECLKCETRVDRVKSYEHEFCSKKCCEDYNAN